MVVFGFIPPLETISKQMKCIFAINEKEMGFMCKIPFPDNYHYLSVLVIPSYNKINECKSLYISNKFFKHTILIDSSRKIFTSYKYGITIIEIIQSDNIKFINEFLEIDENIYNNNLNNIYKEIQLYSLFMENDCISATSFQPVKSIEENYIYVENGISKIGAPLLNRNNFKLIGINKSETKGVLIKGLILEFNNYFKNNENQILLQKSYNSNIRENKFDYKNKNNLNIINDNIKDNNKKSVNTIIDKNYINYEEIKKNNEALKKRINMLEVELEEEKIKNKKLNEEINNYKKIIKETELNSEINKEVKLEKYPTWVTFDSTTTILQQMKNCICKI